MPAVSKLGTKKCQICEKVIELKIKRDLTRKQFCSKKCKNHSYNYNIKINCTRCDKEFLRDKFRIDSQKKIGVTNFFCSMDCCKLYKMENGLQQKAFILYLEGKTQKEISIILEKPSGTIGSWLNKQKYRKYTGNGKSYSSVKNSLLKRNDYKSCIICGFDRIVEVAHIIPASKGGDLTYENTLPLCPNHHHCFDNNNLLDIENDLIKNELRKRNGTSTIKIAV